jgi:hypothetical protein
VILRRDDQIGCPTLSLIDDAEARLRRTESAADLLSDTVTR